MLIPVGEAREGRPRTEWLDTDWDVTSGCAWRVDDVIFLPAPDPEGPSPF